MNWIFLATCISFLSVHSACEECPSIYLRYSMEHSFCKPRSSTCPIFHSGVTGDEQRQIVHFHNKYRSLVATGKETKAGGLPEAADMLQMVWDQELAVIAQRRAEQCISEHDCNDCRRVENFPVGQSIISLEKPCNRTAKCSKEAADWAGVIKMLYDQVDAFDKRFVKSVMFLPDRKYEGFTQLVWSQTWRVGCGFVAFEEKHGYSQLYICNYGPRGNEVGSPMYKTGSVCSSCPVNSCCGKSCDRVDYSGLCRMNENDKPPLYRLQEDYIFNCEFGSATGDCISSVVGVKRWRFVKALGGSFADIILNGGEISTLQLHCEIKSDQNVCFMVTYSTGAALEGLKSSGKAKLTFEIPHSSPFTMSLPNDGFKLPITYNFQLGWRHHTMVEVAFTVPRGDPAQFFSIHRVMAKNGLC